MVGFLIGCLEGANELIFKASYTESALIRTKKSDT